MLTHFRVCKARSVFFLRCHFMFVPFIWCFSADIFYLFYFLHNTWLVPFCIFLTRYSCLLVIRSESYKQSEARCVCGGGVFPPSLPETLIDLKFCCFFFFLQLSLLMLTFRRFYTKIHIFLFVFFSPPSPNLFPCFSLSLLPPHLTFHSRQLSLVQLDCFVRAHHLHSD